MPDGPPPWASKEFSTPPPDTAPSVPASGGMIPGGGQYSTPPPGGMPSKPPPGLASQVFDPVNRFVGGMYTGELDPLAGIGIDLRDRLGLEQSETPAGKAGRIVGNVFNPSWEVLRPIQAATAAIRYGSPVVRSLAHLAANTLQGSIAGAVMPGDDRWEQAKEGGGIGAVLGIPGAVVRGLGFPSLKAATQAAEREIPGVRQIFNAARSLSLPDFNRAWYKYVLEPIGGRVPLFADRQSLADVERQVGQAITRATRGMTLDAAQNATARVNLSTQRIHSRTNLLSTGNAVRAYDRVLDEVYGAPMQYSGGVLDSAQFQAVTSNLEARIRAIDPISEENRALRRELERFRVALFDNSSGGDKTAWRQARTAWQKFAIARDGSTNTPYGLFTPDSLGAELDKRYPLQAPSGRAPHQPVVEAGQQALVLPGRAAAQARSGRAARMTPGEYVVPGTAAAAQEQDLTSR